MKNLGTTLMVAGTAAFITRHLNVDLAEGLSIPTLPTNILGGVLPLAGVSWKIYQDLWEI
jgi:hypothetical protein